MYSARRKSNQKRRRGSFLIQGVIFGSAVGIGVAALAVDTGMMYTAKQEIQTAADSAALAAASQLGEATTYEQLVQLVTEKGALFAGYNEVAGVLVDQLDLTVTLGNATLNTTTGKFEFQADSTPYNAVRATITRDATASDGPVSLVFAQAIGMNDVQLSASATAMLVPRDIAVVIDFSGSMNDDSELRHYKDFQSEIGGPTRPGVQINLEDVWLALPIAKGNAGVGNGLDPPPPGNPHSENDQPGTGPGSPANAGGNPCPGATGHAGHPGNYGPRWGWLTSWGDPIVLDSYTPVGDSGLYYIPRYSTCNDADVIENITTAGYTANERAALLSGQYDGSTTLYRNRTKVLLGLAGWRSKKMTGSRRNRVRDSKYNGGPGDGDNRVESNELWQELNYQFNGGSWNEYINYMKSNSTRMKRTDSNFRYRYGIKTFVNYLLEWHDDNDEVPELAAAPEQPLNSVKDAVNVMIEEIIALETTDHVSLEAFARYGYHLHALTDPSSPDQLPAALREIPTELNTYQAGHYTTWTNIGDGLDEALRTLSNDRNAPENAIARTAAAKVIMLLTDGKPNTNEYGNWTGNDGEGAVNWAMDRANTAKALGMTIYTVGVGADVNTTLLESIASSQDHYFFADNAPDPNNDNKPKYVAKLQEIFQTLGGRRPVRLIQ